MRKILLIIIIAGSPAFALAQQTGYQRADKAATTGKLLPLKGAARSNSCAEFGAGFVKVEGSDTCVKVGGYVSIGAGGYMNGR
jgi:hypothetical protein